MIPLLVLAVLAQAPPPVTPDSVGSAIESGGLVGLLGVIVLAILWGGMTGRYIWRQAHDAITAALQVNYEARLADRDASDVEVRETHAAELAAVRLSADRQQNLVISDRDQWRLIASRALRLGEVAAANIPEEVHH